MEIRTFSFLSIFPAGVVAELFYRHTEKTELGRNGGGGVGGGERNMACVGGDIKRERERAGGGGGDEK